MTSKEALEELKKLYKDINNLRCIIKYSACYVMIKTDLEKLEVKETPMKPIANHYEEIGEKPYIKYTCPKCNNKYQLIKNHGEYCPYCGQRLDWSECNDR